MMSPETRNARIQRLRKIRDMRPTAPRVYLSKSPEARQRAKAYRANRHTTEQEV